MDDINESTIYTVFRSCRFCGGGGGYKMPIVQNVVNIDGSDVDLKHKIRECLQMEVNYGDKLPPLICELCIDKLNDFYEFYEMCREQVNKTRSMLGLPSQPSLVASTSAEPGGDCILGVTEPVYVNSTSDDEEEIPPNTRPGPKSVKMKKAKVREPPVKVKIAPIKEPEPEADISTNTHSKLEKREAPKALSLKEKDEKKNKEDKSEKHRDDESNKDRKSNVDNRQIKDGKNKEDRQRKEVKNKDECKNREDNISLSQLQRNTKHENVSLFKAKENKKGDKVPLSEMQKKKEYKTSLSQGQKTKDDKTLLSEVFKAKENKKGDKVPLSEMQKRKEYKTSLSQVQKTKDDKTLLSEVKNKKEEKKSLSQIKVNEKSRSFNKPNILPKPVRPSRSSIVKMVKDELPDFVPEEDALLAVRNKRPREVSVRSVASKKSRSSITPKTSPQSSPHSSRASTPLSRPSPAQTKFTCKICDKNMKNSQALSSHLRQCHVVSYTISGWECNACGEWFDSPGEYASHHDTHKSYVCERRCGDKFTLYQPFNDHIPECLKRLELPDVECTACLKYFPTMYLRDTHKCSSSSSKKIPTCAYCLKKFSNYANLRRHYKSCSQKNAELPDKTEKLDPRVQPVQVRIMRCDRLLDRIKDYKGHYDVFMVPCDYGTDKKCYYPYLLRGLKRDTTWGSFGMVNISDEIKSEFSKKMPKGEFVHWDSSDTESETELDKPRNPKRLTAIALKTIYSAECMGRVPKRRRKGKKEINDFDNDVDTEINDIISNLDAEDKDGKTKSYVDQRDSFDHMFSKKQDDQVTNNDFDNFFGESDQPVISSQKAGKQISSDSVNKSSINTEQPSQPGKDIETAKEEININATERNSVISKDAKDVTEGTSDLNGNCKDNIRENGLSVNKDTINGIANGVDNNIDVDDRKRVCKKGNLIDNSAGTGIIKT